MGVAGELQIEGEVMHVIAHRLIGHESLARAVAGARAKFPLGAS